MSGYGNYDFTVPVDSDAVTGAAGNLEEIQTNFEELASIVSATERAGTAPLQALSGMRRGTLSNGDMYRDAISGAANDWLFQRASGAGWQTWMSVPSGLGGSPTFPYGASGISLDQLADVTTAGALDGYALVFSGGTWSPAPSASADTLDGLSDVNVPSPSSGQVLVYNGTEWVVGAISGTPAASLAGLSDVTITSPTSGQALVYDGVEWVNGDASSSTGNVLQVLSAQADGTVASIGVSGISQGGTLLRVTAFFPASGAMPGSPSGSEIGMRLNDDASAVYNGILRGVGGTGTAYNDLGRFGGINVTGAVCGRQCLTGIVSTSGIHAALEFTVDRYAEASEGKVYLGSWLTVEDTGASNADFITGYCGGLYRKFGAVSGISLHISAQGSTGFLVSGAILKVVVYGS